jgi:cation diffusion facilitator family transporter
MANRSSTLFTIYAAIAGNFLVAATKFAAALWTGSSAMLSESVHSLVDTGNETLLIYGERRAAKPPDAEHPFGHGRELYFWSFVVALLIFALGAGLSVLEGIRRIQTPGKINDPMVNYVVLALSAAFEGATWRIALRNFRRSKGKLGYFEAILRSKDPPAFMVLLEDTAALMGIALALAGTTAAVAFNAGVFDGIASIAIGILLALVSILLARESKSLLIGEPASPRIVAAIRDMAIREQVVAEVRDIWTVHLGPDRIVANLVMDLLDSAKAADIATAVQRIETGAKAAVDREITIFVKPSGTTLLDLHGRRRRPERERAAG